jgi:drug/metabolite transporter (DMT)-like permease
MMAGVAAAIGAAFLYNLAVVLQKREAETVSASGVAILAALTARPLWLLGIVLQLGGFFLHSLALTEAPLAVVQAIIATGVAFLVLFAALILHERPTVREFAGAAMAVTGVSVLALLIGAPIAIHPVAGWDLGLALASAAVVAAALLGARYSALGGAPGLQAALIGAASGMGQGMSDAMNRLAGAWLSPHAGWVPPASIGTVAVAFLFLFGLLGFVAAQNAFQRYRANTVVPCMITAQLFVPVAIAITLYGQSLPPGGRGLGACSALLLTVAGVAVLSRARGVERALAVGDPLSSRN